MPDDNTETVPTPAEIDRRDHNEWVAKTASEIDESEVTWDQHAPDWCVAWRFGKPVSAFRFESREVNQRRCYDDQLKNPVGMWHAWVPGPDGSRIVTWPEGTPIEQMKAELIEQDVRLH